MTVSSARRTDASSSTTPKALVMAAIYAASRFGAATVRLDTLIRSVDHACRVELGRAVMDLGGWLWRLGLEKYEAVFRENEISEKVLPSLTAEDLKELGVARSCET